MVYFLPHNILQHKLQAFKPRQNHSVQLYWNVLQYNCQNVCCTCRHRECLCWGEIGKTWIRGYRKEFTGLSKTRMFNIKTSITVNNNVFTESSPVPLLAAGTTQCWLIALLCLSFCGINCQSLQLHWWSSGRHDRVVYSLLMFLAERSLK